MITPEFNTGDVVRCTLQDAYITVGKEYFVLSTPDGYERLGLGQVIEIENDRKVRTGYFSKNFILAKAKEEPLKLPPDIKPRRRKLVI